MSTSTAKYRKTPKGLLTNMYNKQIYRCMKKDVQPPTYTLNQLHERFLNNYDYLKLHENWASNGHQYYDVPSIDRKNPELGYTLENIQIMTWRENREKGDKENAIRFTTAIVMNDMEGNFIKEYDSIKKASSELGISQGLISMCCQGKRKHTKGFVFKYRGDKFKKNPHLLTKEEEPT